MIGTSQKHLSKNIPLSTKSTGISTKNHVAFNEI
jgi:hypothetical protein